MGHVLSNGEGGGVVCSWQGTRLLLCGGVALEGFRATTSPPHCTRPWYF